MSNRGTHAPPQVTTRSAAAVLGRQALAGGQRYYLAVISSMAMPRPRQQRDRGSLRSALAATKPMHQRA
jgi:hypothetical protein